MHSVHHRWIGTAVTPAVITDILIAFALGFVPVQRLKMGLRAGRLLPDARAT